MWVGKDAGVIVGVAVAVGLAVRVGVRRAWVTATYQYGGQPKVLGPDDRLREWSVNQLPSCGSHFRMLL
jgi:hypothetical protein